MSAAVFEPEPQEPRENYLNAAYGIRSWLLTRDHKRIALLYLVSINVFFFLGGLFALLGGALYVLITVGSVLFGRRVPDTPGAVPLAALPQDKGQHVPFKGTMVLVFVFLASFVIYYFLNWKWLADIWIVK